MLRSATSWLPSFCPGSSPAHNTPLLTANNAHPNYGSAAGQDTRIDIPDVPFQVKKLTVLVRETVNAPDSLWSKFKSHKKLQGLISVLGGITAFHGCANAVSNFDLGPIEQLIGAFTGWGTASVTNFISSPVYSLKPLLKAGISPSWDPYLTASNLTAAICSGFLAIAAPYKLASLIYDIANSAADAKHKEALSVHWAFIGFGIFFAFCNTWTSYGIGNSAVSSVYGGRHEISEDLHKNKIIAGAALIAAVVVNIIIAAPYCDGIADGIGGVISTSGGIKDRLSYIVAGGTIDHKDAYEWAYWIVFGVVGVPSNLVSLSTFTFKPSYDFFYLLFDTIWKLAYGTWKTAWGMCPTGTQQMPDPSFNAAGGGVPGPTDATKDNKRPGPMIFALLVTGAFSAVYASAFYGFTVGTLTKSLLGNKIKLSALHAQIVAAFAGYGTWGVKLAQSMWNLTYNKFATPTGGVMRDLPYAKVEALTKILMQLKNQTGNYTNAIIIKQDCPALILPVTADDLNPMPKPIANTDAQPANNPAPQPANNPAPQPASDTDVQPATNPAPQPATNTYNPLPFYLESEDEIKQKFPNPWYLTQMSDGYNLQYVTPQQYPHQKKSYNRDEIVDLICVIFKPEDLQKIMDYSIAAIRKEDADKKRGIPTGPTYITHTDTREIIVNRGDSLVHQELTATVYYHHTFKGISLLLQINKPSRTEAQIVQIPMFDFAKASADQPQPNEVPHASAQYPQNVFADFNPKNMGFLKRIVQVAFRAPFAPQTLANKIDAIDADTPATYQNCNLTNAEVYQLRSFIEHSPRTDRELKRLALQSVVPIPELTLDSERLIMLAYQQLLAKLPQVVFKGGKPSEGGMGPNDSEA